LCLLEKINASPHKKLKDNKNMDAEKSRVSMKQAAIS
jgi:hypothetical protein